MSQTTTTLSKFLELSDKAVEDVYKNPTKTNWKKLEQITQMVQNQIAIDAKELLDKYPTDENAKLYNSIKYYENLRN